MPDANHVANIFTAILLNCIKTLFLSIYVYYLVSQTVDGIMYNDIEAYNVVLLSYRPYGTMSD